MNLKARSGMQLPSEFEVRGELYMKTADFDAVSLQINRLADSAMLHCQQPTD